MRKEVEIPFGKKKKKIRATRYKKDEIKKKNEIKKKKKKER